MQNPWTWTQSPRHLIVFDAAARHGSFTQAAAELDISQPAVSTAIRQLEASMGVSLFQRDHKRVVLTAAGQRFSADVSRAFDMIDDSVERVRQLGRNDYVTLNASTAFNHFWLMPRLAELHQRHPRIDLRLQSSDREPDIDAEQISLAIRRGDGSWQGCDSVLIAEERLCPVASVLVMQKVRLTSNPASLLRYPLVHLEEPIRERPGWADWLAYHGVSRAVPDGGLRLNDYALVLQAAMAGEGFAMGWRHQTDALVEQGLLADLARWEWRTGVGFYLVWSNRRPLNEGARQVRDWLVEKAET